MLTFLDLSSQSLFKPQGFWKGSGSEIAIMSTSRKIYGCLPPYCTLLVRAQNALSLRWPGCGAGAPASYGSQTDWSVSRENSLQWVSWRVRSGTYDEGEWERCLWDCLRGGAGWRTWISNTSPYRCLFLLTYLWVVPGLKWKVEDRPGGRRKCKVCSTQPRKQQIQGR